jgi:uncharacterized membrane protein
MEQPAAASRLDEEPTRIGLTLSLPSSGHECEEDAHSARTDSRSASDDSNDGHARGSSCSPPARASRAGFDRARLSAHIEATVEAVEHIESFTDAHSRIGYSDVPSRDLHDILIDDDEEGEVIGPFSPQDLSDLAEVAADVALAQAPAAKLSLSNFISRIIPTRLLGMTYLALSAVIFSVMALLVSILSRSLPSFEIVLARCSLQFLFALLACLVYRVPLLGPPGQRLWLLLRGALGFVAFSAYYFAIAHLTLGDATTIYFTSPLYTGIIAYVLLKEPMSWSDVVCTLCSVIGVVLIVRPPLLFGCERECSRRSRIC